MDRDRGLAGRAASAAIDRAAQRQQSDADRQFKTAVRGMWALGDYHTFSKQLIWELGPVLVDACGIEAGQRVLDVAAGTGNVAIRAAQRGAHVVASDLTPEHFEAGRREARAHGVELEWREADAEALPFANGEFDVVTSAFGAIFAPRHQQVANELRRVCRPGGTIGMLTFTPIGTGAAFFNLLGAYLPPAPPDALPPLLWGSEAHVRELFGGRVSALDITRHSYIERASTPRAYVELFTRTFGPVVAVRTNLAENRRAAFDQDLMLFAREENRGASAGPAEYEYEYLLVVARA